MGWGISDQFTVPCQVGNKQEPESSESDPDQSSPESSFKPSLKPPSCVSCGKPAIWDVVLSGSQEEILATIKRLKSEVTQSISVRSKWRVHNDQEVFICVECHLKSLGGNRDQTKTL